MLINVPVLSIYQNPNASSPLVSQGLYGQPAKVLKSERDWALIETSEGYQGYALLCELTSDQPLFSAAPKIATCKALTTLVYPKKDVKVPHLLRLSLGTKLPYLCKDEQWSSVQLLDGSSAWVYTEDLTRPFDPKELIGLPYIWGGSSSQGYDCSGFVQAVLRFQGLNIPRDSYQQAESSELKTVEEPQKGDILFFGDTKIDHVGIYLGEDQLLHATPPSLRITSVEKGGTLKLIRRPKQLLFSAQASAINEPPHSYQKSAPVHYRELVSIKFNHFGFDDLVHQGEIVVHEKVANEVIEIFQELFEARYPIDKCRPIDLYNSCDLRSTEDNNSSGYCCRPITGSDNEWSIHSLGLAIDINPLLNPYKRDAPLIPPNSAPVLSRSLPARGVMKPDDACHTAFTKRGWQWGGDWKSTRGYVDYQHFYKSGPSS